MFAKPQNGARLTPQARFWWGPLFLRFLRFLRFLGFFGFFALLGILGTSSAQPALPDAPDATQPQPTLAHTQELLRVQNLVRANVLGLAREILETRGPAAQPTPEWLQWERQLWTLYRVQGLWRELYERTQQLPPAFPLDIRQEAQLQAVTALTALQQGSAARELIRAQLPARDTSQLHLRRLRQALIAAYLADDLLVEAHIAMRNFRRDYGVGETDWLLLSAGVLLRSGNFDGAINLLAPLDPPEARLLRLYARLGNRSLTPAQVVERALKIRDSPRGHSLAREIQAVMAEAHRATDQLQPLAGVLEDYLLAPASQNPGLGVYPRFEIADLFEVYEKIAHDEANAAGLLVGEEQRWLEHARQLPPDARVARRSLFAWLADVARASKLRQDAMDSYVTELIDIRRTALIAQVFGPQARLGKLSLGGETGLRLSAHALDNGDFQLAAEANANLSALPAGIDRNRWLLQAGRVDIFAGRYRQGGAKLSEWIESLEGLDAQQTDTILQPIFDLQTAEQHPIALELLYQVNARAPAGGQRREIAYWIAESYHGDAQYLVAADWFLHSALQQADGFDRWGQAARFRAAEALMEGGLFGDARRLFEDMLVRADSDASRNALKQKLQRLWLLESGSANFRDRASPDHDR